MPVVTVEDHTYSRQTVGEGNAAPGLVQEAEASSKRDAFSASRKFVEIGKRFISKESFNNVWRPFADVPNGVKSSVKAGEFKDTYFEFVLAAMTSIMWVGLGVLMTALLIVAAALLLLPTLGCYVLAALAAVGPAWQQMMAASCPQTEEGREAARIARVILAAPDRQRAWESQRDILLWTTAGAERKMDILENLRAILRQNGWAAPEGPPPGENGRNESCG